MRQLVSRASEDPRPSGHTNGEMCPRLHRHTRRLVWSEPPGVVTLREQARRGFSHRRALTWGHSSGGTALEWHSRVRGFDSPWLHQFAFWNTIVFSEGFPGALYETPAGKHRGSTRT